MKLTKTQIAEISDQINADPLPDDGPAADLLKEHFGDHTFYVDEAGLHIFETDEADEVVGQCRVFAVRMASWASEKRDALSLHDPIVGSTSAVIEIEGKDAKEAKA